MEQNRHTVDLFIGIFMLLGFLAFSVLAFKVSGLTTFSHSGYYVSADFSNIGGLKVRAPVTVAGVKIGEVAKIELKPGELSAKVTMLLRKDKPIPYEDTEARVLTEGLIGTNYISIIPGFGEEQDNYKNHPYLRDGDVIAKTQEAIILENLIGQLLFNINKG